MENGHLGALLRYGHGARLRHEGDLPDLLLRRRTRRRALVVFSAPDESGVSEAIQRAMVADEEGSGREALFAVLSRADCGDFAIRMDQENGELLLTLVFPVKERLPVSFFQGRKKRKKRKD